MRTSRNSFLCATITWDVVLLCCTGAPFNFCEWHTEEKICLHMPVQFISKENPNLFIFNSWKFKFDIHEKKSCFFCEVSRRMSNDIFCVYWNAKFTMLTSFKKSKNVNRQGNYVIIWHMSHLYSYSSLKKCIHSKFLYILVQHIIQSLR